MQWYMKVLKQYADFDGRARRTEFWMFVLFNAIVSIVLGLVDALLETSTLISSGGAVVYSPGILVLIYSLAVLIPSIAVTVRRLHDTDRSGFWWFIQLVPIVGGIVLLVFMCLEGTRGPNRFGMDPKQQQAMAAYGQPENPAMPV